MEITLLYDNTTARSDCRADWGFSCLIRGAGLPVVLFDTGADDAILLHNMEAMKIDPSSVDVLIISHPHFDHTGGLAGFIRANPQAALYLPHSFRGVRRAKSIVHVGEPVSITDRLHLSGEVEGKEVFLMAETSRAKVLVSGCFHPSFDAMIQSSPHFASFTDVVGGLHGMTDFDFVAGLNSICPTHCTRHIDQIQTQYPEKYRQGGVGCVLQYPD